MSQTRWSGFREAAIRHSMLPDPEDRWVAYGHPLANARSAQSTAGVMRLRFPDLEIKTRKGVIYARVRPGLPASELVL